MICEVLLCSAAGACTPARYSGTCSPVRFTSPRGGRGTQLYYTLRNIMAIYCDSNKYNDKGIFRTPEPITSMEAVLYLSKIPKFSMKVAAGVRLRLYQLGTLSERIGGIAEVKEV